jgi:3-oxoadipate enol-lactonase
MPFYELDDIMLYYEVCGVKGHVPLLFLHGVMSNSEIWRPQVEHFQTQRRLILLDLRGHGQSDKPHGRYTIAQLSDDLYGLLNHLDIAQGIIVGHSLGGMTALRFTLDHQEMVDKLILIDATAQSAYSWKQRLLLSLSTILMDLSYRSFLKIYLARYADLEDFDMEETLGKLLETPKHVTKSCFSAIAGFDVTSELVNINVPTLIIHGSESSTPLVLAESMHEHIPHSEFVIIEGAGHASPKENPEEIWNAIGQFIKR